MMERKLRLIVQAAGVVYTFPSTTVHTGSIVVVGFQQGLFHIPVTLLCADAELEIFLGDAVPVLPCKLAAENMDDEG